MIFLAQPVGNGLSAQVQGVRARGPVFPSAGLSIQTVQPNFPAPGLAVINAGCEFPDEARLITLIYSVAAKELLYKTVCFARLPSLSKAGSFLASNLEYGYGIDHARYKGQKKDSECDNT